MLNVGILFRISLTIFAQDSQPRNLSISLFFQMHWQSIYSASIDTNYYPHSFRNMFHPRSTYFYVIIKSVSCKGFK